jgi:hypothetical protein
MGAMMQSKWRYVFIVMLAALVLGASLSGTIMSLVEQPAYLCSDPSKTWRFATIRQW